MLLSQLMSTAIVNVRKKKKITVYDAATMTVIYKAQNRLFYHELTKLGFDLPSLEPLIDLPTELKRRAIAANRAVRIKIIAARAEALRLEGGQGSAGDGII